MASSLALDGVDLALCDGYGDWPGLKGLRLLDMRLAPLAAPALLRQQPVAAARWPPTLPLLGLQGREWLMWLRAEGVDDSAVPACSCRSRSGCCGLPDDLDHRRLNDPRDNSGQFDVVLDAAFARVDGERVLHSQAAMQAHRVRLRNESLL
jgi:hypothetical protein